MPTLFVQTLVFFKVMNVYGTRYCRGQFLVKLEAKFPRNIALEWRPRVVNNERPKKADPVCTGKLPHYRTTAAEIRVRCVGIKK